MAEDDEQAQWMPECDDCDENEAEHYCNTCGDKLCTGCKDHHLSRKKNRNHQVVPYSSRTKAKHKSLSTCEKHPGEKFVLYCNPCQYPVCTACVAESCGKHELTGLAEAFSSAKDTATEVLKKMMTEIKPALKEAFEENNKSVEMITSAVTGAEDEMKKSAKRLHNEIDKILDQNLSSLHQTKEQGLMPVVQDREGKLNDVQRKLDITMKKYEENLRSDDPADLLKFMKGRYTEDPHSLFPIPQTQEVSFPIFMSATPSKEALQKQFGRWKLSGQKENEVSGDKSSGKEIEDKKKKKATSLAEQQPSVILEQLTVPKIITQPIKQTEIKIKEIYKIYGLRCSSHGERIWIHDARKMYLVDFTGRVIQTVDAGCRLYDETGMLVVNDNELHFSNYIGGKIMKVPQTYTISALFETPKYGPNGLCHSRDGNLLVCMGGQKVVLELTWTGDRVREIGRGSLQWPNYVACNNVTNDICVSDNGKQVVVFQYNGEKRFTYTGDGTPGAGFDPWDLCCDQLGNILITDRINHRVHIIDSDGHFLQYLVSGEENISCPIAIDIISDGRVVVGEYSGIVKVYKYLQ